MKIKVDTNNTGRAQDIAGFTTQPLTIPARGNLENDPEFARMPRIGETLCGLKRGYLYLLEKERRIKTISLRRRGSAKGVKLISVPSLRAYLQTQLDEQNPAAAADAQAAA